MIIYHVLSLGLIINHATPFNSLVEEGVFFVQLYCNYCSLKMFVYGDEQDHTFVFPFI